MAIIGIFQCDQWCFPTQNWLKNSTNDISIQEFPNVTRHYVKDTGVNKERLKSLHRIPEMKKYRIVAPSLKLLNLKDISSYQTPQFTALIPYK